MTACSICASALFVLNPTSLQCELCTIVGCINCSSFSTCVQCNSTAGYILLANDTCSLCASNTFPNTVLQTCEPCAVPNCLLCATLNTCLTCDNANFYVVASNLTCIYCDPLANSFINGTTQCEVCSLPNCLNCSSLATCRECNEASFYYLNPADDLCYTCPILNCNQCFNYSFCTVCDTAGNYVLNGVTGQCDLCTGGLFANATSNQC